MKICKECEKKVKEFYDEERMGEFCSVSCADKNWRRSMFEQEMESEDCDFNMAMEYFDDSFI